MHSILTITTPADSYDLTTLASVKLELGLADRKQDPRLKSWIRQASGAISDHCKRVFAQESLSEQFRIGTSPWTTPNHWGDASHRELILSRSPVIDLTAIVENDATLDTVADYECYKPSGLIYRLCGNTRRSWPSGKIIVTYTAGYSLIADLPFGVERACNLLVKFYAAKADQNPLLRSEEAIGVQRFDYQVNQIGDDGGLPPDVISLLEPYREMSCP